VNISTHITLSLLFPSFYHIVAFGYNQKITPQAVGELDPKRLKLNFKEKNIKKNFDVNNSVYELTDAGYENIKRSLSKLNIFDKSKEYDRIRFKILRNTLY